MSPLQEGKDTSCSDTGRKNKFGSRNTPWPQPAFQPCQLLRILFLLSSDCPHVARPRTLCREPAEQRLGKRTQPAPAGPAPGGRSGHRVWVEGAPRGNAGLVVESAGEVLRRAWQARAISITGSTAPWRKSTASGVTGQASQVSGVTFSRVPNFSVARYPHLHKCRQ